MNVSRRQFCGDLALGTALTAVQGCLGSKTAGARPASAQIALQLYSIRNYIGGVRDDAGKTVSQGVGLEKALDDVASIGYAGVEFAGYYGHGAKDLRKMLRNSGIKACGVHGTTESFGLDTKTWTYDSDVLKRACEFNMEYGNNLIVCPGTGNYPPGCDWSAGRGGRIPDPTQAIDDFAKKLTECYDRIADDAAKFGCRIGIHNHTWEHAVFLQNGTSFWDYFFSNTSDSVCMELDVGWATCVGVDPKDQYVKYPHRSPTLHAKENGMGTDVKIFDGILGKPGLPGARPVDWDGLIPVAEKDGVQWFVVECECHFEDLSAVLPSFYFLKAKGLG